MKSGKMSSVIQSATVGVLRLWILVGAAVVAVAVAVGTLLLALNRHFTQTAVTKALEDRFTAAGNASRCLGLGHSWRDPPARCPAC